MTSSPSRSSLAPYALVLVALIIIGGIGIGRFTVGDVRIGEAAPVSETLSVDERTYYEYVAPRLDRLVVEVDEVVKMVDGRSRDIIALTVHGERIETLTTEIIEFGESSGIPGLFTEVHQLIQDGSETINYTFDEARTALRTFNFSQMTSLVPQFHQAADTLQVAQDEMRSLTNDSATNRMAALTRIARTDTRNTTA